MAISLVEDLSEINTKLDGLEERLTEILGEVADSGKKVESLDHKINLLDNRIDALLGREHDDSIQWPDDLEEKDIKQLASLREKLVIERDQASKNKESFKQEFSQLYQEAKSVKSVLKEFADRLTTLVTECGFNELDYMSDTLPDNKIRERKQTIDSKRPRQTFKATEIPVLRNNSARNAGLADGEVLLNSRQVGNLLNMGPDEVVERARKSQLPGKKIGKTWKFRKSDIEEIRKKFDL